MEEFRCDLDKIKSFLACFSRDHFQRLTEDDPLPHRLLSFFLIEKEVEAEVMDWIVQYLTAQKAPNLLCSLVAREAVKEVVKWDLTSYLEPLPSSQECEDEVEGRNNGDSDTDILEDMDADGTPKIEVNKLARDVFNKVHEICKDWAEKLPEFFNSLPQEKTRIVAISVYAIRNTRRKMEDRHLVMPYLSQHFDLKDHSHQALFTVFDGHGGTEAAVYSAAHLHYHMARHKDFAEDPVTAIKEAFKQTEKNFIEKAKREHLRSGSTCVTTLLRGDKLYVAWLGDSQVMMVKDGQPQQLMDPHKPEREDEKKRIESQGGFVMWFGQWRVNATLSVSRAIGDADFKPFVSADPDIDTVTMTGDEDYLVLGCDGLWDTMSCDDVSNAVYKFLQTEDKADVAKMLTQKAKEKGSGDNISIIVVFFKDKPAKPKPMAKPEAKSVENDQGKSGDSNEQVKEDEKEEETEKENIDQSCTPPEGSNTQTAPGDDVKPPAQANVVASSAVRPFRMGGGFAAPNKIPTLFKKPVPYNVYKVLLKHQHHHSKYRAQMADKTKGAASPEVTEKEIEIVPQMRIDTPAEVLIDTKQNINNNTSPILSGERLNLSTQATKYLCHSDKHSDNSSTRTADHPCTTKSISSSRKVVKKSKNGKKRNLHRDLRRLSRDRLSLGIAERARSSNSSGSSPRSFHHQFVRKKFLTPQYKIAAAAKITGSGATSGTTVATIKQRGNPEKQGSSSLKIKSGVSEGIVGRAKMGITVNRKREGEQLTGVTSSFGYMDLSPTSGASKWTVAREIENAAAMFGE